MLKDKINKKSKLIFKKSCELKLTNQSHNASYARHQIQ
jgi:hypothetical protein